MITVAMVCAVVAVAGGVLVGGCIYDLIATARMVREIEERRQSRAAAAYEQAGRESLARLRELQR